jgi:hypothetical protein
VADTAQEVGRETGRRGARPVQRRTRQHPTKAITWAHLATLAGAFVLLLVLDRHQWFISDEWAALVSRRLVGDAHHLGIWDPHNEHWATIPVLVYRALYTVFGLRTYLPYLVVLLVVHLVVVHLLWRVLLRVGIEPLLATCLCGVFAVLGAASDDLALAWQWQLIGPLVFGLAAILVVPERGPWRRRDVGVWVLLVLGLMCSGVAITMTAVVALINLLRRGWRCAVATVAVPAAVYGLWYVTYGHKAVDQSEPLRTALRKAPAYVWQGVTGAINATIGFEGVAAAIVVVTVVWLFLRAHPRQEPWPIPLSMAAGAVTFLFLTDIRRSGLGIDLASTSRYVYVTMVLALPLLAMALDALLPRGTGRLVALAALAGLLLLVQLPLLHDGTAAWARRSQPLKHRVMATAELLRQHTPFLESRPNSFFAPQLTVDDVAMFDREGKLPGNVPVDEADLLDARTQLQLSVRPDASLPAAPPPVVSDARGATLTPGPEPGCVTVEPTTDSVSVVVRPVDSTEFRISTGETLSFGVAFQDSAGIRAPYRNFKAVHGVPQWVRTSAGDRPISLVLPFSSPTVLCGVRGA